MAAESDEDVRNRKKVSFREEVSVSDSEQEKEKEDVKGGSTRSGLLSCIAGVGGVSITIWLLFFVFLEPYDPNKSPCTQLGSSDDLQGGLKLIDTPPTMDWNQFARNIGLNSGHLAKLPPPEEGAEDDVTDRVDAVLRTWYSTRKKACWETVVKALFKMRETESAERLAKAYRLKVNQK